MTGRDRTLRGLIFVAAAAIVGIAAFLVIHGAGRNRAIAEGQIWNGDQPSHISSDARPFPPAGLPLSKYVGSYPFDDVEGSSFAQHRLVINAVQAIVKDPDLRDLVLSDAVTVPIWWDGHRIMAAGCEPHNCAGHHWVIAIEPDGSAADVCYQRAPSAPAWHLRNGETTRTERCPFGG